MLCIQLHDGVNLRIKLHQAPPAFWCHWFMINRILFLSWISFELGVFI